MTESELMPVRIHQADHLTILAVASDPRISQIFGHVIEA